MSRIPTKRLIEKEGITAIVFIIICTALALEFPASVGTSNLAPPVGHAAAPWIFGPVQILLLYFPPWLGALFLPVILIVGLCSLPWLAKFKSVKAGGLLFSLLLGTVIVLLAWFMLQEVWMI